MKQHPLGSIEAPDTSTQHDWDLLVAPWWQRELQAHTVALPAAGINDCWIRAALAPTLPEHAP